jgi:hypothetical protein
MSSRSVEQTANAIPTIPKYSRQLREPDSLATVNERLHAVQRIEQGKRKSNKVAINTDMHARREYIRFHFQGKRICPKS